VPAPRIHRHRYHGVLAPNAKLHPAVTSVGKPEAETPAASTSSSRTHLPRSHPLVVRRRGTSSSTTLRPSIPPTNRRPKPA
jgi:hypothetical protein